MFHCTGCQHDAGNFGHPACSDSGLPGRLPLRGIRFQASCVLAKMASSHCGHQLGERPIRRLASRSFFSCGRARNTRHPKCFSAASHWKINSPLRRAGHITPSDNSAARRWSSKDGWHFSSFSSSGTNARSRFQQSGDLKHLPRKSFSL